MNRRHGSESHDVRAAGVAGEAGGEPRATSARRRREDRREDGGSGRADIDPGTEALGQSGGQHGDETGADEPAPTAVEELGRHAWALLGIGLVVVIGLVLLSRLTWLVAPAAVTVIFAVIAAPLVRRLVDRGWRRSLATAVVYVVIVAATGLFVWIVGPAFSSQISRLAVDVPGLAEDLSDRLEDFQNRVDAASGNAAEAIGRFRASLEDQAAQFGEDLSNTIIGLIGSALGFLGALLIGLFVSLLIVLDLPNLTARARARLERPENSRIKGATLSIVHNTAVYVRGQLAEAFLVGALKTIALWLIGVPYFLPLGVLSGVGNLIPGVGPVLAAIPAILVAYSSDDGGLGLALLTAVVLAVVQFADYTWFAPTLSGRAVRLPTLVIVVALILGAGLFGIFGLLIAIPVASAIRDVAHWVRLRPDEVDGELRALDEEVGAGVSVSRRPRRKRERQRGARPNGSATPQGERLPAGVKKADPRQTRGASVPSEREGEARYLPASEAASGQRRTQRRDPTREP